MVRPVRSASNRQDRIVQRLRIDKQRSSLDVLERVRKKYTKLASTASKTLQQRRQHLGDGHAIKLGACVRVVATCHSADVWSFPGILLRHDLRNRSTRGEECLTFAILHNLQVTRRPSSTCCIAGRRRLFPNQMRLRMNPLCSCPPPQLRPQLRSTPLWWTRAAT